MQSRAKHAAFNGYEDGVRNNITALFLVAAMEHLGASLSVRYLWNKDLHYNKCMTPVKAGAMTVCTYWLCKITSKLTILHILHYLSF